MTQAEERRNIEAQKEAAVRLEKRIYELKAAARNATKHGRPYVAGDLKVQASELQRALDTMLGKPKRRAKVRREKLALTMEDDDAQTAPARCAGCHYDEACRKIYGEDYDRMAAAAEEGCSQWTPKDDGCRDRTGLARPDETDKEILLDMATGRDCTRPAEDLAEEEEAAGWNGMSESATCRQGLHLKTNRHLALRHTANGHEQIELRISLSELVYLIYRVRTDDPRGYRDESVKEQIAMYLEDAETALTSIHG